jgi:predicted aminopeptidase
MVAGFKNGADPSRAMATPVPPMSAERPPVGVALYPLCARAGRAARTAATTACLAFLLLALSGCTSFRYLVQAGYGQRDIALRTRALSDVIDDPRTPPRTRDLLERVPEIKRFAERHGLTPTKSYDSYAYLPRSAAVWVVTGCEPLSFRTKSWTFPIVGSVPYLGWFSRADADAFARDLANRGWDVDVRGAAAYSTLGWFNDPILSTMIEDGDGALGELANTVLHESTHATVYVPGQSGFNESVASFVADGLTRVYLDETEGERSATKQAYVDEEAAGEASAEAMHEAYVALEALYASKKSDAEKLAEKRVRLRELEGKIRAARPVTNATLADFKAYNTGKAELSQLLALASGDWRRLVARLAHMDEHPFPRAQDPDWPSAIRKLSVSR